LLKPGDLSKAFKVYWDDAERCCKAKAYWCLLHVTVCLPDVCAALQSPNGKATSQRYEKWCNKYFNPNALTGLERYEIRCKILHQGRARSANPGRYSNFSFGQPDASGRVDHLRIDGRTLHLDVVQMYNETRQAIRAWILELEGSGPSAKANSAANNLLSLVRVSNQSVPVTPSSVIPGAPILLETVISKTH
jgi:hypothetical protein